MTIAVTPAAVSSGIRVHPLALILVMAAAIRLPLAFVPNIHFSDEIFQVLEPASRLLGHHSVVTWEWREGTRPWLLPALMAGPAALGDALMPDGVGAFYVARLAAAFASLSIVASAWLFGARISERHAIVASVVAAIWFEIVFFAPHTLSEPLATAAILPAAWIVTQHPATGRQLFCAGALLALAFVVRFHYAPAILVLIAMSSWRRTARLWPMALGAAATFAIAALADLAHGATPFAWIVESVRHNIVLQRAAGFGVQPLTAYIGNFYAMWSLLLIPLAFAIRQGWRHAPALWWMAVVNIASHSLIGHKEYRFIFLSIAALVIIAALGSADWITALRGRTSLRRAAQSAVIGGWIAASLYLAMAPEFREQWTRGVTATQIADELRNDPAMCGVALLELPYFLLPGRERIANSRPIYNFTGDDRLAVDGAAAALDRTQASFNRIVSRRDAAAAIPSQFAETSCVSLYSVPVCIFARPGACRTGAATSFELNETLVRLGL